MDRSLIPAWPLISALPKAPGAAKTFGRFASYKFAEWQLSLVADYGRANFRFLGFGSREGSEDFTLDVDLWATFLVIVASSLFLFAGLFGASAMLSGTYIVVITLTGLVLGMATKGLRFTMARPDRPRSRRLLIYAGVALGGALLANAFSNLVPSFLSTTVSNNSLTTLEISAAEETFFRGFFLPFFVRRLGAFQGNVAQAVIFAVYHTVTYGDNPGALLFVFGAGFAFGYADIATGSLFPSLAGHFLNQAHVLGLF